MVTKEEIRQIVRDETLAALSLSLPILAERIEKFITSILIDSNSHPEDISSPDGLESVKLKVRA